MRRNYSRRMRFEQLEGRQMMAVLLGDYDQNGTVAQNDYNVWKANFGQIGESPIDGSGNGVVDAADYTVWRDNLGKTLADLPPIAPQGISAAATGATSIQISWQSAASATSYAVQRRQPDTETSFTTIAPSIAGTSHTDSTASTNTLYEYRVVAQNANGNSTPSQSAQATAGQANLTAYRPQSVQDAESPIDAPIYAPFVKRPVRDQDEQSNTLGPGIRINTDDDNNNGQADRLEDGSEIPLENDLIEVRVDRLPGQGDLVLQAGGKLKLYYDHDKETPIPFDVGTFRTEPLSFTANAATVFVEWIDSGHGGDNLFLIEASTSAVLDAIRFHSFRSLTVVFGGRGQNPNDTDGDGSIGDVVGGANREGIFDVAQSLYDTGWDVMAFESTNTDIDTVIGVAEQEIKNAWDYRLLDPFQGGAGFGIMGYSWGGGASHDLIESLSNDGYFPYFSLFLDAVVHGALTTNFPQDDWPTEALYLLNLWQPNVNFEYGGGRISNPEEMGPFSELEEHEYTNEDHYSIDDDATIQQLIRTRLNQRLVR